MTAARVSTWVLFVVQTVCALFFVGDILLSVLGIYVPPMSWQSREIIEIAAALGLILGLVFGAWSLILSRRETAMVRERLRRASSDFIALLNERFAEWALTPAERDVAFFAIKGMNTAEIAALRHTSEGTVKAQSNAIYRKAGVNGRGQLLCLFIEDLMAEAVAPHPSDRAAPDPAPVRAVGG